MFGGATIPFGALVHYLSSTKKGTPTAGKSGPSIRRGIFVGYFMHPGAKWSKHYVVVDWRASGDSRQMADMFPFFE